MLSKNRPVWSSRHPARYFKPSLFSMATNSAASGFITRRMQSSMRLWGSGASENTAAYSNTPMSST